MREGCWVVVKLMEMGKWSEFSLVWVCQVMSAARWAEIKVRSGEEGLPLMGSLVGEF